MFAQKLCNWLNVFDPLSFPFPLILLNFSLVVVGLGGSLVGFVVILIFVMVAGFR